MTDLNLPSILVGLVFLVIAMASLFLHTKKIRLS